MEKHLVKEVISFWWLNQDNVSIARELYKEFNTRVLFNIYCSIPPFPLTMETADFMTLAMLFYYRKVFIEKGGQI